MGHHDPQLQESGSHAIHVPGVGVIQVREAYRAGPLVKEDGQSQLLGPGVEAEGVLAQGIEVLVVGALA